MEIVTEMLANAAIGIAAGAVLVLSVSAFRRLQRPRPA
jgi:hypothetical protein